MEDVGLEYGRRMESLMLHNGLTSVAVLGNHMIRLFANNGSWIEANEAFHKISNSNAYTWSTIISANAKFGETGLGACTLSCSFQCGRLVHEQIIINGMQSDLIICNTLLDMYAKCENLVEACHVFQRIPNRSVVSWNSMIAGYSQNGEALLAIEAFEKMQEKNMEPTDVTFLGVLKACARIGFIELGRNIHNQIIRRGLQFEVSVANTLVDMYTKCGSLKEALKVFNKLWNRSIVSWGALPTIDPSTIDVLLVTHFHLDHCASLPYFLEKTFKGRVFMTHATKAIYKLLLSDFVKISKVSVEDMLYDEQDINRTMDKIEVIDFHQTIEVNGIRFWCYTAGHVLGAAMFMVDIAGVRVLYTGDYSREEDRHLRAAELLPFSPDVCIIESTYGVQIHQPRMVHEKRFTETVAHTVSHGGRVLIPAFALGRAQELLLILDEYWEAHPELQHIPIYYASPLAKRCMTVYQTYINAMNDKIKSQLNVSNPFEFKHISPLKSIEQFEDVGPSVVMASPGGLQSGLSRQLFDRWCQDKKNSCVIPGYVVEGTLAKTIINEPKEVTLMNGLVVPLHMHVHYISFSAHADFSQTSAFLNELKPPNIILVHGEANEMGRLKAKLLTQFADQNVKVLSPKNCQTVEMFFKGEKIAKAVGKLAEKTPKEGDPVNGLLVKKGFTYQLMAPEDLHVYTQLSRGSVMQRQSVPYKGAFTVLRHRLQQMYESVETMLKSEFPSLRIHDKVTIVHEGTDYVILHWISDPVNDMVADSIIAMILKLDSQSLYGMVSNGHRSKEARLVHLYLVT